jgi:hypothetical protein
MTGAADLQNKAWLGSWLWEALVQRFEKNEQRRQEHGDIAGKGIQ